MKLYNCDIYKFEKISRNKNIVCFGAGQQLRIFLLRYVEMQLQNRITAIADNCADKIGNEVCINGIKIPVIGTSQLVEMRNFILIISCADIGGIIMQLNQFPQLDDIWCFAVGYMISETNELEEKTRWYPSKYEITPEQLIPKKIHYCWFGHGELSQKQLAWMESWKKLCPDYEITEWNEHNYDVTQNTYMYQAYQAGKWAFVSDYARLDIVYRYGGIYLDTDVELLRNLDELLYQHAFMGIDGSREVSLGLGFGAEPYNKVVGEIRKLYDNLIFTYSEGKFNLTACPTLQKPYFIEKGYINNGDYQILDGVTIYPKKVLSPMCNYTGRVLPVKHSFSIHHYEGSWTPDKRRQMKNKYKEIYQSGIFKNVADNLCGDKNSRNNQLCE